MKKCKLCNKKSDVLEKHHILPKSIGGLNYENNLIEICIDCHELIHDVKFRGKTGLIKKGMKKSEINLNNGRIYIDENSELVDSFFHNLAAENIEKFYFILFLFENKKISGLDIKNLIENKTCKVKCSFTINLK